MIVVTHPNPFFKCVLDTEEHKVIQRFNPLVPDVLIEEWINLYIQQKELEIKMSNYLLTSKSIKRITSHD